MLCNHCYITFFDISKSYNLVTKWLQFIGIL
nr:MAG TPA_asm: hypothetical protein [Caudoviricetes sp.]